MPRIEIYTKTYCSFCYRAKMLLDAKGVDYDEHAVDHGGAIREEMIRRSGGRTTVPQIFVGNTHVGGWNELSELDRRGELDPLLAAR